MPEVRFPLGPGDDGYQDLLQAAEAVERVAERYHTLFATGPEDPWGLDCEYIGRLDAAALILRSCLKEG